MELTLRPATPTERLYAKRQCIPIMERCGSPGILVAELDDSGTAFYSHWDIWDPAWKTPEFSVELDAMIEMLRSDQRYGPVLNLRFRRLFQRTVVYADFFSSSI